MRLQNTKNTSIQYFHDKSFETQLEELKLKMEQVLVLAVTDYSFSYLSPSLLAASASRLILSRLDTKVEMMAEICKSIGAIPVSHATSKNYLISLIFTPITHFRVTLKNMSSNWKKWFPITFFGFHNNHLHHRIHR